MSSYQSYGVLILAMEKVSMLTMLLETVLILMMAMMNGMRKSGVLTLMLETVLILMMAMMKEVKMYQARMN
jgi:hypothetical protein